MSEETDHSHELDKIRRKKMKALVEAQRHKQEVKEKTVSIKDKVEFVLKVVLASDAFTHLQKLKENEPQVYQRIFSELVSPDVIHNIDYLISLIQRQGGVPRKIPLDAIIFLERKVKGITGKIKVKRGDELMDLGSYLSK